MRPKHPAPIGIESANCSLPILNVGECEPLKAVVHTAALGLAALMAAYNIAAWLRRRQSHLAFNAAIYLAATVWEQRHVTHHLMACRPLQVEPEARADLLLADDREAA